ncbi:MAG: COQ9 family protein [Pseudomonadota bacterium]
MQAIRTPDHLDATRATLIEAALPHVPFDGWSAETLRLALSDTGTDPQLARMVFPRGGVDMALGFHRMMDRKLSEDLVEAGLGAMRVRDRVTHAVRRRIELVAEEREAVRRGATLLALPFYAPDGARAIWETADIIWTACGDTADDYNWYTKRGILASVYSATVLFWLGDESAESQATWEFLDRRIENVMQFEKTKAQVEANPVAKMALWGPIQVLKLVRAPGAARTGEVG